MLESPLISGSKLSPLVMCRLRPEARSQAKPGQAKPGLTFGLGWALAWPEFWKAKAKPKPLAWAPAFVPYKSGVNSQ